MKLLEEIDELRKSDVQKIVNTRLKEFENFKNLSQEDWFSELCFCILTANSKAETAMNIQKELNSKGFSKLNQEQLSETIRKNKHRFHNNKARYIIEARRFLDIKNKLLTLTENDSREFIVSNIKGLGYKEASHFLRNTGSKNLAILDRHIINLMVENNLIQKPKALSKNNYLEIEKIFGDLSKKLNMSNAELDLYMWYLKTGIILK